MWILEHLALWVLVFLIAAAQCDNLKDTLKATGLFIVLLYLFMGGFFLIIFCGGHIGL